jgi:Pyruvate/2-oxoacid:ferredoxin oxidoreductase delta subunit
MLRQIIKIDEEKCDGCGLCIPSCKEGAIQIIEGKARLISDLFCDGLGACLGTCPLDAIQIEEREAEPYNERKVIEYLVNQPTAVLKAHLMHLIEHNEMNFFNEAVDVLNEFNIPVPIKIVKKAEPTPQNTGGGCPGSLMQVIARPKEESPIVENNSEERNNSELKQWPIQLHLVRPDAPYFKEQEIVIMSTCGPVASANVHSDYIKDKAIVIACPKLDYTDPYIEKLTGIFQNSNSKKAVVVIMEVPCCKGLSKFVSTAAKNSGRTDLSIEEHTLTLSGDLKSVVRIF